jgi:sensor histidine kinase YesM
MEVPRGKFVSIRKKFYSLAAAVFIISITTNIISYASYASFVAQYKASIITQNALSDFFQSNRSLSTLFSNYILTPTISNRQSFEGELGNAELIINRIITGTSETGYNQHFVSLGNMLLTFKEKARDTIALLGTSGQTRLYEAAVETQRVNYLIDYSYKKYMDMFTQSQASIAEKLLRSMRITNVLSIVIISAGLSALSLIFLLLSARITRPIISLAKSASELSRYNFEMPGITVHSNDEIGYLADTFNTMQSSIVDYIDRLEKQKDISQKLIVEENKNLKMTGLLKEANIKTLQAQINSHFLFNTLNLISRTAFFEGAPKTIQLIDTMTDFLKYSLSKKDSLVSIFDEIAFAETYIIIQRMRFEDHISIDLTIDDDLPDVKVPSLIIQPLIENAIVHGAYDKITKTDIKVLVTASQNDLLITVSDNGNGMNPEDITGIFAKTPENFDPNPPPGSGLRNVKERLQLYLNDENCVVVSCEKGKFFQVDITVEFSKIPGNHNGV